MPKRLRLGIPFNYDDNWIGGTYYIKNLILALKLLPPRDKPEVWVLAHSKASFDFLLKETAYEHLNWLAPALLANVDGGISRKARWLGYLTPSFFKRPVGFDMIFPYPIDSKLRQTVCWIPDFQDKRLPEFFSQDELKAREAQHRQYFETFEHIVFSSQAAADDFSHFYPEAKVNRHVVRFAVFEPASRPIPAEEIRSKYGITRDYFYCPNQFWIHKNHRVVIRAASRLKAMGRSPLIVFSGKEHDHRAPEYANELKAQVRAAGLDDNIKFVGFIPREDQVVIFRESICVVQPSLFEGWSTVIEDAKSLGKFVVASSIPANLEQARKNAVFFDPQDDEGLAQTLATLMDEAPRYEPYDYAEDQKAFASSFYAVLVKVAREHAARQS